MSVLPSGLELSSINVTPEYMNNANSENKVSLDKNIDNSTEKQKAVIQQEVVDKQPLTLEQLEKVAQQLQDFVGEMNRGLEFSVDKDSGRDVIKVIDKASGDLVKQYPSEEVLTLVSKLSDMVGGFIDAKV